MGWGELFGRVRKRRKQPQRNQTSDDKPKQVQKRQVLPPRKHTHTHASHVSHVSHAYRRVGNLQFRIVVVHVDIVSNAHKLLVEIRACENDCSDPSQLLHRNLCWVRAISLKRAAKKQKKKKTKQTREHE